MTDQIAVGSSGKHGQAAYATQDLQPGEYILREFPAFTISPPAREQETGLLEAIMNARNISAADIAAAVKTITSKQTEEFRKVACVFDTDLSRFMCVHYDIRPMHNEPPAAFGYFSKGSYFNHSCRPNAHYFWDERSKSMTWLALTNIMSGEEITISYLPIIHWETVSERRSLLKRLFLFECDCEFCEVESSNDTVHAQRIKVNNLHNAITDLLSDLSPTTKAFCSRGKHLADDYITLVTNDLQSGQSIDPKLYKAYYLASVFYSRSGNSEKAASLRSEAADLIDLCFGGDCPQAQYEREFCEEVYPLSGGSRVIQMQAV